MNLRLLIFQRLLIVVLAGMALGCDVADEGEPPSVDEWKAYSEHERVFACMYTKGLATFPDPIEPADDYALIIHGDWDDSGGVSQISAILADRDRGTIERERGLEEMTKLFSKIRPESTIRSYFTCTVPLTYEVSEKDLDRALELIPDGLHWMGDMDENLICTCKKQE